MVPAKDFAAKSISGKFTDHRVPRGKVRTIHEDVFGKQAPGPRKKNSAK
jgi:hypothetical protein